jgi:hypothetical protein
MQCHLEFSTFLRSVTFGNGFFVAVGGSYLDVAGIIATSRDGTNWIPRAQKVALHSVAYGSGMFAATGDAGTILVSQDAVHWTKRCSGTARTLAAIAFGNGTFVGGGESGIILTSTNGIHWFRRDLSYSVYVGRILFRDGLFLAGGSNTLFTSTDGQEWSRRATQTAKVP